MAEGPAQAPAKAQVPDMDVGPPMGLDRGMARGPVQARNKAGEPGMDLGRATDQARALRTNPVATPSPPEIDAWRAGGCRSSGLQPPH